MHLNKYRSLSFQLFLTQLPQLALPPTMSTGTLDPNYKGDTLSELCHKAA